MSGPAWYRIGEKAGGDIVLAIDVDGTARSEATFHDLAPLLTGICDVRLAMMPDDMPGAATMASAHRLLDGWSRAAGAWASQVRAVFGYCSGGPVALALADRLEYGCGVRPEVILFDPERPTASTLSEDFTHAIDAMSALSPEERGAYLRRAHDLARCHGPHLERVVEQLAELYGEACGRNLARLGVAPDLGIELELAFRRYCAFLLCASRIAGDSTRWSDTTALLSADAPADGFDCRRIRIDAVRGDLLRSEATAAHVRTLMKGSAA